MSPYANDEVVATKAWDHSLFLRLLGFAKPHKKLFIQSFLVLAGLIVTYLVAPRFYLSQILEINRREGQLVERITFGSALLASILLGWTALQLGRRGERLGAAAIGVIGAAAFFFAGEEASWGQHWLGFEPPQSVAPFGAIFCASRWRGDPKLPVWCTKPRITSDAAS